MLAAAQAAANAAERQVYNQTGAATALLLLRTTRENPALFAPGAILARPVVLRYGPSNGGWVFQFDARSIARRGGQAVQRHLCPG